MSASANALTDADYAIPTTIFVEKSGRLHRKSNQCLFHGAGAFRRESFDKVHGYPFIQSGQDQGFLHRLKAANCRRADPLTFGFQPSYVYRWFTTSCRWHLSAMGTGGYERLAERGSRLRFKNFSLIGKKTGRGCTELNNDFSVSSGSSQIIRLRVDLRSRNNSTVRTVVNF